MEQLVQRVKANKPKIKEIKVIQKARELRSSKRRRSSDSKKEQEKDKIKKTSHHALKSQQDGLAGEMQPSCRAPQFPKTRRKQSQGLEHLEAARGWKRVRRKWRNTNPLKRP